MPSGNWAVITPGTPPAVRAFASMYYHPTSNGIVLFGGYNGSTYLSDTHLWTSPNWAPLSPATVPAGRMGHACCYDGTTDLFMFGGEKTGPALTAEMYRWNATDWLLRAPAVTTPSARKHMAMAEGVGQASTSVWMWGGDDGATGDDDMYYYDDGVPDWFAITPVTLPTKRSHHFMVYDPDRDALVMWGGIDLATGRPLDDAWEFRMSTLDWAPLSLGATKPSARAIGQDHAYDPNIKRIVLGSSGRLADGSIKTPPSTTLIDGEIFTVADGYTADQDFEIDTGGGVAGSSIAVDLTAGGLTAIQVAIEIRDAVNSSSLTIVARIDPVDATRVLLDNTKPGPHGIVAIVNGIASTGFITTGMTNAAADTWTFNAPGRIWSEQQPLVQPAGRDGACTAYDGRALVEAAGGLNVPVQFGGVTYGQVGVDTYLQDHNHWAWSTLGLSPYWSLPGSLQGRLDPTPIVEAPDGTYVFVLGSARDTLPRFMLNIGDELTLSQIVAVSGQKLLRFAWRMRYSPDLPKYTAVVAPGVVDFRTSKLLDETTVGPGGTGDSLRGVILESGGFTSAQQDQLLVITGATNGANNATVRISAVPENQGKERRVGQFEAGGTPAILSAGRAAVLEHAAMVQDLDDPAVSLNALGAQWRAQMLIDAGSGPVLRAELVENVVQSDPDGWQRSQLAAHISQISAVVTLIFKLTLESVTS